MTTPISKNDVIALIEEHDIRTVQIGYADIQGVMRGKYIPARFFVESIDKGVAFCVVALGWDIQCMIVNGLDFSSWANGFPDMLAKPDLSTFHILPWREKTAFVICNLVTEHGDPFVYSPRYILEQVVEQAKASGFTPFMASELEFYLLREDARTPLYGGVQCYNVYKGGEAEFFLGELRESMAKMGIYIEASNTEYGPAQFEVNIRYSDAVDCADKAMVFKNGTKELARNHGLYATFMSKPWYVESGNGYHCHQSLWDLEGKKNLFEGSGHEMNDVMKNYLGGLLKYARDLQALAAWSINAYKRVAEYSYAPTRINWGEDNRTTGARAIMGGTASRLEYRVGAAEANPYLYLAANLAAGLEGINSKLSPPEKIVGDGYAEGTGELLCTSLDQAVSFFEKSKLPKNYFGEKFVDAYVTICKHELDEARKFVSEWERERYLEFT
ncbi:MAG: glutamine synthetase family protein [Deltaproteobacteria bacterium]